MNFGVVGILVILQSRGKWSNVRGDFQVGDIFLLKDSAILNYWPMAKIFEAMLKQFKVYKFNSLQVGDSTFNNANLPKTLVCPTQKISCWWKIKWFNSLMERLACNDQDDISS